MRILVTGPTGFIGATVVDELLSHGHDVSGLVREGQADRLRRDVRPVVGDLTDAASLTAAARRVDAVAHLGAVTGPDLPTVDRGAAEALLAGLGGGQTLTYTSGAAVPGGTGDAVGTEDTPKDPNSFAAWRGQTEDALLSSGSAARVVVIRPPLLVYGRPGAGLAGRMLDSAVRTGIVDYVGDGSSRVSTVRVDDLADLYVRAAEDDAATGVYIGASDDVVRIGEVADAAAAAAGARTRSLSRDEAQRDLGMLAALLSTTVVVSGAKARTRLGWQPSADGLMSDLTGPAPWVAQAVRPTATAQS